MGHFLKQEVNVQLFLTLGSTLMIFLHGDPIERKTQFFQRNVKQIAYKDQKIKVLGAKRTTIILLKYTISQL